jgi:hypothetical protein
MSGAIHPIPKYAFMAWCSVKVQGQIYFTSIPLPSTELHRLVLLVPNVKFHHFVRIRWKTNSDFAAVRVFTTGSRNRLRLMLRSC